eukprot:CAMPEP_0184481524 /NCGR_PEP_ID=MMETSP0113_2-20130426/3075_1 /TAXON_ID=91329 /ORGANISM="Norrisiella sphaerica, Strain BC52" /LENGTH=155 /DNA_ID=CAMNT_0026860695 /DNA_START=69 /DNA_END=536 /DNA_ORIENTATION=-
MPSTNYHTFLQELADDPEPGVVYDGDFTEEEGRLLRDVAVSHLLLSILGIVSLGMTVLAWSELARKLQPHQLGHHLIIPGTVWYPDDYPNSILPFQPNMGVSTKVGCQDSSCESDTKVRIHGNDSYSKDSSVMLSASKKSPGIERTRDSRQKVFE